MKKLLVILCAILLMVSTVKAEDKVKVYMFEAGDCPYCEAEMEYLQSLEGYNKTFEVVRKELYVDHVNWAEGKDYELGKKVAETFEFAGYEEASYLSTPFVVISDIYAVAGYNTELESIIAIAASEGDKDAVSCIAANKDDCIRLDVNVMAQPATPTEHSAAGIVLAVVGALAFVGAIIYVFKAKK